MPEGDTLHRIARTLAPALEGAVVVRVEIPRAEGRTDFLRGKRCTRVEARGKNLLVHFEGDAVLHAHLKMTGRVALYDLQRGRPKQHSYVSFWIETATHVAVGSHAPVARLLSSRALARDPMLTRLGPDVLDPAFDPVRAAERFAAASELEIGDALMNQGLVAGLGNVYKSEVLWSLGIDPFARVGALSEDELVEILALSQRLMRENVTRAAGRGPSRQTRRLDLGGGPLSVYGRRASPCFRCGSSIVMRAQGSPPRNTYHCPTCQPARETLGPR